MKINYKREEAIQLLQTFLKAYEIPLRNTIYTSDSEFDEFTYQTTLYDMIKDGIDTALDKPNGTYIYELCSLLGIYQREDDTHERMIDQIEEIYGPLDGKTIVEVACGAFAPISAKIAERTKGTAEIIAIDPKLVIGKEFGITPVKAELRNKNQIPDNAIVVAKDPCNATFNLGHFVTVKNVQLYTMLCHCDDYRMRDYIFSNIGIDKDALEYCRPHYLMKQIPKYNTEELRLNESKSTLWRPLFRIFLEDRLPDQEVHQTNIHDSLYNVDKPVVYTIKK